MAIDINVPSQVKTYANLAAFPVTGSLKTIFIAEDTNKTYRWTGSVYVEVSAAGATGITIGTTAITSGTVGRVLFEGTGNVVQESANLFWDLTNNRLGLGTSSPTYNLDVQNVDGTSLARFKDTDSTYNGLTIASDINGGIIGNGTAGAFKESIYFQDNFQIIRFFTNGGERIRIATSGNVSIGTTVNAGFLLDVNGTARVSGQTSIAPPSVTGALTTPSFDIEQTWNTTGAPNAFTLNVSDTASGGASALMRLRLSNTTVFSIAKDGYITFGGVAGGAFIAPSTPTTGAIASGGQAINISHNITSAAGYGLWLRRNSGNRTATSGDSGQLRIFETFAPTSGTGTYNTILIDSTINQTGGANGITRGLYIAPTLTASTDFRAIETTVGKVCFNTTSGNTLIGTTTDAGYKLDVNGTARVGVLTCGNINPSGTTAVSGVTIYLGTIDNGPANNLRVISKGTIFSDDYSFLSSASAFLEVKSTTKGFLPPRMTTTQKNAIASPASGLMVYDTTLNVITYYNGTTWI